MEYSGAASAQGKRRRQPSVSTGIIRNRKQRRVDEDEDFSAVHVEDPSTSSGAEKDLLARVRQAREDVAVAEERVTQAVQDVQAARSPV